jgi:hypothetical protein
MDRLEVAKSLRHLFVNDDGSLPDIFIENLSPSDFENIMSWIEGLMSPSPFKVWSIDSQKELTFTSPLRAAKLFSQGKIEPFRFPADDISFGNQIIPTLGMGVYSTDQIEFDYRMGKKWTDEAIVALLTFLSRILEMSSTIKIRRDGDSTYPNHQDAFKHALSNFEKE